MAYLRRASKQRAALRFLPIAHSMLGVVWPLPYDLLVMLDQAGGGLANVEAV